MRMRNGPECNESLVCDVTMLSLALAVLLIEGRVNHSLFDLTLCRCRGRGENSTGLMLEEAREVSRRQRARTSFTQHTHSRKAIMNLDCYLQGSFEWRQRRRDSRYPECNDFLHERCLCPLQAVVCTPVHCQSRLTSHQRPEELPLHMQDSFPIRPLPGRSSLSSTIDYNSPRPHHARKEFDWQK